MQIRIPYMITRNNKNKMVYTLHNIHIIQSLKQLFKQFKINHKHMSINKCKHSMD